ncbi:MAG: hypothetical protein C4519_01940 [Desulfobacteraceae bacterium]|nr:MAG: hypothetical protein C4519_01940 [Desulfobacteraceae bacterium]
MPAALLGTGAADIAGLGTGFIKELAIGGLANPDKRPILALFFQAVLLPVALRLRSILKSKQFIVHAFRTHADRFGRLFLTHLYQEVAL